jgi:hypothetical protein
MSWFSRLWSKRLVLDVPADTRLLFELAASSEGLKLQDWAVRVLTASVLKTELTKLGPAYRQSSAPKAMLALVPPPEVPGHPCAHLRSGPPAGVEAKDCQGTCGSPKQPGHVCYWVAQVADQCGAYAPKPSALRRKNKF